MEENINKLIRISQYFGQNHEYIIAGGGNSSYKDQNKIWVKASGISMATIDQEGFVCLDRAKMQVISEKTYSVDANEREKEVKEDMHKAVLYPEGKRPSVEASMHEKIKYPFVMHTHPTLVNGMLCAKASRRVVEELYGEEAIYIEYTDPGYILFKTVDAALTRYQKEKDKEAQIIFLENHGVFVGADSTEEIEGIYADMEKKLKKLMKLPSSDADGVSPEYLENLFSEIRQHLSNANLHAVFKANDFTLEFLKDQEHFYPVSKPFTPDNIVYCKSNYLFFSDGDSIADKLDDFIKGHGYLPKVIAVQEQGIIAMDENSKSAQIVMDIFKDMMKVSFLTRNFGGPRPMSPQQINFIDNWEVENYRRKVSKEG